MFLMLGHIIQVDQNIVKVYIWMICIKFEKLSFIHHLLQPILSGMHVKGWSSYRYMLFKWSLRGQISGEVDICLFMWCDWVLRS